MINPNLAMGAGAGLLPSEAEAKRIEYERGRGQAIPTMVIEAVEGGSDLCLGQVGKVTPGGTPGRDDDLGRTKHEAKLVLDRCLDIAGRDARDGIGGAGVGVVTGADRVAYAHERGRSPMVMADASND